MVKVQSDVGTYAQLPRWVDLSLYGKSGVSNNHTATIYTTGIDKSKKDALLQLCKENLIP